MALSTMNATLPALEGLLAVPSAPLERVFVPPTTPPKKSVGRSTFRFVGRPAPSAAPTKLTPCTVAQFDPNVPWLRLYG